MSNKENKQKLFVGNLNAKRLGHAIDYVEAMWKILQYKKPEDFVICTGKQFTKNVYKYGGKRAKS